MNPYGDVIREHSQHPRNHGSLEAPDIRHEDVNPFCGDRVRIEVILSAGEIVREARFEGDLCVIAKAASSLLTEMITGERVDAIDEARLLHALHVEIQPARLKCALLPLTVLQAGVAGWRRREDG